MDVPFLEVPVRTTFQLEPLTQDYNSKKREAQDLKP